MMKQALLIVLDSVGVGNAPDAARYGDLGANTLGHIRDKVTDFELPALESAGLRHIEALAGDLALPIASPQMSWGCLTECSAGKDTTTGHWELAGVVLEEPFATFEHFPEELLRELEELAGTHFLGNIRRSGTLILEDLGPEHLRTGKPILYTSADSVLQIAAHVDVLPIPDLYALCERLRPIAKRERIGRIIARPFEGAPGSFQRTQGRHDFSYPPPATMLDTLQGHGVETVGIGKIGDIFDHQALDLSFPSANNAEGCAQMDHLLSIPPSAPRLLFANLVDFDMLYGHRRDPSGYARCLSEFDHWFSTLIPRLSEDTLLLVTADHGNDPTWSGTDHTRERVPLLMKAPGLARCVGIRDSFADVAATLLNWFEAPSGGTHGRTMWSSGGRR
jgi:phosphopentomutase